MMLRFIVGQDGHVQDVAELWHTLRILPSSVLSWRSSLSSSPDSIYYERQHDEAQRYELWTCVFIWIHVGITINRCLIRGCLCRDALFRTNFILSSLAYRSRGHTFQYITDYKLIMNLVRTVFYSRVLTWVLTWSSPGIVLLSGSNIEYWILDGEEYLYPTVLLEYIMQ